MTRLDRLTEKLRRYATGPCIESGNTSHTYAQLLDEMQRWQSQLDEFAVLPGDVVAIRAEYSASAIAALLAILTRHAVAALIPRDKDALHYLTDAHATGLLEIDSAGNPKWRRLTAPPSHPLLQRLREAGEGGIIIFTSGSSGRPKAALQSVEKFLTKTDNLVRNFRSLAFLLFDHVAGMDTLFATLATGGTLILTARREPDVILKLIESHRVELLPTSPSFLRLLCATPGAAQYDLSSLRVITYGSEPMDQHTLARVNTLFPNVRISQKYGTTETGAPRSESRGNDSLWLRIKDGAETKIVDGVLWVRSPGMFLGYLNAPSPIDEDGWYCTGDLVEVDGDWIKIQGRKSDTINVGGEKVSPVEVERSILQLDFVREAVVSGEPHALMGHIVTARVALRTAIDTKEAAASIRSHCRQHLAPHKVPVKIEFSEDGLTSFRQKAIRRRDSPQ